VILNYANDYPPDSVEIALPDARSARRMLEARRPDIVSRLTDVAERIGADARTLDATLLGTARLALRHGSFGPDFHAYHNEAHALELAERRLVRLIEAPGSLAGADAAALLLFAACHDVRQREADAAGAHGVGGNEAASIAETFRLLDACGFDRGADAAEYIALELMIAGSTFDSPFPLPGGALARNTLYLDASLPGWRKDARITRGERLARLAADLDTANAGEAFELLCETALRLCREREMRAERALDDAASAAPCLEFLGPGQQRYFFDLHRFCSREGERVFGPQKAANAPRVRQTGEALSARFAARPPADGQAVLDAFAALTGVGSDHSGQGP